MSTSVATLAVIRQARTHKRHASGRPGTSTRNSEDISLMIRKQTRSGGVAARDKSGQAYNHEIPQAMSWLKIEPAKFRTKKNQIPRSISSGAVRHQVCGGELFYSQYPAPFLGDYSAAFELLFYPITYFRILLSTESLKRLITFISLIFYVVCFLCCSDFTPDLTPNAGMGCCCWCDKHNTAKTTPHIQLNVMNTKDIGKMISLSKTL